MQPGADPDSKGLYDERGFLVLPWEYQLRTLVGRFLIHLVLTGALVLAPTLRVLCYRACVTEASPMVEKMPASDAPEFHGRHDSHHSSSPESDSAPLEDDCTHGGESSSSSLSASLKSFGGDGIRVLVTSPVAAAHLLIVSSNIHRDIPSIPRTGQLLGLFLTPLRI